MQGFEFDSHQIEVTTGITGLPTASTVYRLVLLLVLAT